MRLPAIVNGTAPAFDAHAVLEVLVALQMHQVLRKKEGIPGLIKEVSQIHRLEGERQQISRTWHLEHPSGAMQRQIAQELRVEALIKELLAIGHHYTKNVLLGVC